MFPEAEAAAPGPLCKPGKIWGHRQKPYVRVTTNMSAFWHPAWAWFTFIFSTFLMPPRGDFPKNFPGVYFIIWTTKLLQSEMQRVFPAKEGLLFLESHGLELGLVSLALPADNWVASLGGLFLTYFYALVSYLVSYIIITCAVLKSPNIQFSELQNN